MPKAPLPRILSSMQRIIGITGAAGHLGGALARRLIADGYKVRALCYHDRRSIEGLAVEVFSGDILNPASLDPFLSGCFAVVHSAAIISISGDPDGMVFRSNTEGPRNIVEGCIRHGVSRLVHVSSTHAVLDQLDKPSYDETNAYKPSGSYAYDHSKALGEQLVLAAFKAGHLQGCVIRPSSIIGPYDFKPSKLGRAILDLYQGHIPVLPPGGYNFVDVRDVANAIAGALDRGRNGEIYLTSGHYAPMPDFARLITDCGGARPPRFRVSFTMLEFLLPLVSLWARIWHSEQAYTHEMLHALHQGHPNMDNSKAKREIGLTIRPLNESIADFLAWEKTKKEPS